MYFGSIGGSAHPAIGPVWYLSKYLIPRYGGVDHTLQRQCGEHRADCDCGATTRASDGCSERFYCQ